MFIVVGLGNPGLRYSKTRHNMGFMTIDRLADKLGIKVNRLKFKAKVGDGIVSGHKVVFVKPHTYMNLSGFSVAEIVDFYKIDNDHLIDKIDNDHLIVIYDDMDLETGRIRLRPKGGPGTHNGMKSVVSELGFSDFPRIRIGIGQAGGNAVGHVIGKISKNDKEALEDATDKAAEAALSIISDGIERAMNKFNVNN